ncbi:MAG: N-acetyltransferase family protein [Gaiellaceae bacterium]
MTPIRALERRDLTAVARLHADATGSGRGSSFETLLPHFLERTLFDHPWADPQIPSLVYEEDGEVVGFLGSNVRRMRFDGDPIRMACSAHLVAHPRARSRGVGGLLLRAHFAGPQELTITDGANAPVQRMWEMLGGSTVHLSCLAFVIALRPATLGVHMLLSDSVSARVEPVLRPLLALIDAPVTRILRPRRDGGHGLATAEPLSPEALLEHLPAVTHQLRLVPDYDLGYLQWLFAELDTVGREAVFPDRVARGPLWAELVRDDGRAIGWYVCHLRRGGLCRVLQFAAAPGRAAGVFDRLERRASDAGAAGIYGRLEPRLLAPLTQRRCLIRVAPARMLVQAREQAIVEAIRGGSALLTRMEGEWW